MAENRALTAERTAGTDDVMRELMEELEDQADSIAASLEDTIAIFNDL